MEGKIRFCDPFSPLHLRAITRYSIEGCPTHSLPHCIHFLHFPHHLHSSSHIMSLSRCTFPHLTFIPSLSLPVHKRPRDYRSENVHIKDASVFMHESHSLSSITSRNTTPIALYAQTKQRKAPGFYLHVLVDGRLKWEY